MPVTPPFTVTPLKRVSAGKSVMPTNFFCSAPQAKAVSLIGDFNEWHPNAHPMKRNPDGSWHLRVAMSHGPHHYLFLVDGKPVLDPRAMGTARNQRQEKVSLITVS